jgi:L-arabinonolactonase
LDAGEEERMRCIVREPDGLGECPTWDDRAQRLLWIDVTGRRLSSCDSDGGDVRREALADIPGSFALRAGSGRLVAYRRRLALADANGTETPIALPTGWDGAQERFNDGACDAAGRFWVGTMHRRLTDPVGALYRIDADRISHRLDVGFGLSNGIAWSPDNRTLYHCDSVPPVIYTLDFDLASGAVANRRPFVTFGSGDGIPDGCAVDTDGFLWVAAPGAGAVLRFDPAGRLERRLATPISDPSSVAFGGDGYRTLFITSIGKPGDGANGAVFGYEPGITGLPKHRFAG